MVELAPRETGKTYLYRNLSYYAHVLSGGKATPAQLFINLNTGKIGEVGTRDAVVFDEIANTDFTDPKSFVSIMQGYMQDARFSRGKKEILAFASLVFEGNIDVQGSLPHEKYYHLFEPLPDFMQVIAFLDRIHAYLPGWEIPKPPKSSGGLNPELLPFLQGNPLSDSFDRLPGSEIFGKDSEIEKFLLASYNRMFFLGGAELIIRDEFFKESGKHIGRPRPL